MFQSACGCLFLAGIGLLGSVNVPGSSTTTRGPRPPYVPTPQDVVEQLLELVGVQKDEVLVDLGCGDGGIVVTAAKKYGSTCLGYELDHDCLRLAVENVKQQRVESLVCIIEENNCSADLSQIDVVVLRQSGAVHEKLIQQLEKMKPGARIVSLGFAMSGYVPDRIVIHQSNEDGRERKFCLWTIPLKKSGK